MELRRYIESFSQYTIPKPNTNTKIELGRTHLFDFDYSFFDDDYKKVFETNFIRHFYFREIGFDVMERFKFELENYMRLNVHYWNKLFESELIDYEILENYKMTDEYKRNVDKNQDVDNKQNTTNVSDGKLDANGNVTATGETTTNTIDNSTASGISDSDTTNENIAVTDSNAKTTNDEVYSDTPQSALSGRDYATNATFTENESDKTGNAKTNTTGNEHNVSSNESESIGSQNSISTQESSNTDTQTTKQNDVGTNNLLGKTKIVTVEDYILTKTGKIGERNYPKMIEEYRATLLRIELQIFQEMNKQLFMLIYNY